MLVDLISSVCELAGGCELAGVRVACVLNGMWSEVAAGRTCTLDGVGSSTREVAEGVPMTCTDGDSSSGELVENVELPPCELVEENGRTCVVGGGVRSSPEPIEGAEESSVLGSIGSFLCELVEGVGENCTLDPCDLVEGVKLSPGKVVEGAGKTGMLGVVGCSPCELVEGMRLPPSMAMEDVGETELVGGVGVSPCEVEEERVSRLGGVRPSPEPAEGEGESCIVDGEGCELVGGEMQEQLAT